ncbi:RDD family protein [Catellatospora sp. NPDC049609]|uniref:RDD family protein n=1 Tax=Catellatospora sp. NPDC049609 TaxID=3155505 RepID=UPI00344112F6
MAAEQHGDGETPGVAGTAGAGTPHTGPAYAAPGQPYVQTLTNQRFAARLIDGGILIGVLLVFRLCSLAVENTSLAGLGTVLALAALAVLFGYDIFMIGQYGQTVGKRVMKLRVVHTSGRPAGWGAAFARGFVPSIAGCLSCGLGSTLCYLSPLFDSSPAKRGWYDQIASTVVVRAE